MILSARNGGGHNSDAGSLCGRGITEGCAKCLLGAPKSLNNFTSTFFNAINFLAKDLMEELNLLLAQGAVQPRCGPDDTKFLQYCRQVLL